MTNDREADLLPCPFCGGRAVVTGSIADAPKNHVVCTVCPVGTRQFMGMEAAQIWNTRTPPASEPSEAVEARMLLELDDKQDATGNHLTSEQRLDAFERLWAALKATGLE